MAILLAGDIGGTKTILRLVDSTPVTAPREVPAQRILDERRFSSHEFSDLVPMVRRFLDEAADKLGSPPAPEAACFGVAGPVVDDTSKVTNLSWRLSGDRLEQELGIARVDLINDFAAIGHGVLGLAAEDLETLQPGQGDPERPIAVIGAGTGLGEGYLVPYPGGHRVFPSEGGHTDFSPRSALEFQLLGYLQESQHLTHVSVERVVSGRGIAWIYEFLRARDVSMESPALAAAYRTWQQEMGREKKTVDLAAEISKAAIAGQDFLSQETMRIFVEAYGSEAGDLALKLLPYGGLYVAGGIAAKNLPLLQRGGFIEAFKNKGRMAPLLERVPVHVVLNPRVGLIGAALHAAALL